MNQVISNGCFYLPFHKKISQFFSWLTNVFSFNGLPTNIFSPMALFGESLFSNVVSTADLGPHVLLK